MWILHGGMSKFEEMTLKGHRKFLRMPGPVLRPNPPLVGKYKKIDSAFLYCNL